MKRMKYAGLLLGFLLMAAGLLYLTAEVNAKKQADRGKLKIGYCQEGGYYEFDYQLYYIAKSLAEKGKVTSEQLIDIKQGDSAQKIWNALISGKSDFFEFTTDCFFDMMSGEFASLGEEEKGKLLARKMEEQQVDLMITVGTYAGLMVKENSEVPYMNFLSSDPVGSGIVDAVETSGSARAWAHVNDGVDEKAISVMDDIFSPEKLGIVYSTENLEAYIYSGAASLDKYAERTGKKVYTEGVADLEDDTEAGYRKYFNDMCSAHQKLADAGIDVYILTTSSLEAEDFEAALQPFVEKGIPVFSINSTEDVRFGALAAVEMLDYKNIGRFAVDMLERYQSGESLADLPQQYVTAPFLVLNSDTLRRTGIKLPLDTLISASEIYGKYEKENE